MFEYWSLFAGGFFGFILLGYLIYRLGSRSYSKEKGKEDVYTCGEPFEKVEILSDNFYQAITENVNFRIIQKIHTGKLSDYILWILIGIASFVLLILVV